MLRAKRGSALTRERTSHPASGSAAWASLAIPSRRDVRGARGQVEAVGPAHQAARLQEAGGPQRRLRNEQPRPEADAVRDLVGLGDEGRAQLDRRGADAHPVADGEAETDEERLVDDRAVGAVPEGEEVRGGALRLGQKLADGRIVAVDGLQLDEARALFARHRHRPHRGDDRDAAAGVEEGALGGGRLAVDQREGHVAAEDFAALPPEPLGEGARDRGDAGDGGDTERDAGEEDAEAGNAAAQFAQGEPKHEGQPSGRRTARRCEERAVHGKASGRHGRIGLDAARAQPDRAAIRTGTRYQQRAGTGRSTCCRRAERGCIWRIRWESRDSATGE